MKENDTIAFNVPKFPKAAFPRPGGTVQTEMWRQQEDQVVAPLPKGEKVSRISRQWASKIPPNCDICPCTEVVDADSSRWAWPFHELPTMVTG